MNKKLKNKENVGNDTIHSVMPRIDHFICEHGYKYECWNDDILTEITNDGYIKFYILDFDTNRNYLTTILYGT